MGVDHTYRYVDATNVYAKGKVDGDVKHSIKVAYNHYTASGFDAIIFYCYVDGKQVANPSFDASDENRVITVWTRTV